MKHIPLPLAEPLQALVENLKDPDTAIEFCNAQLISADTPEENGFYCFIGDRAHTLKDPDAAIEFCNAQLIDADTPEENKGFYFFIRGWAHALLDDLVRAKNDLTCFIYHQEQRDRTAGIGYKFRAECYRALKQSQTSAAATLDTVLNRLIDQDIDGALHDCTVLLKEDPEDFNAVFLRGLATDFKAKRLDRSQTAGALKFYEAAIQDYTTLINQYPTSHFLEIAYERRGKLRLALAPEQAPLSKYRAFTEAINDFNVVIEADPANIDAYLHRGQARMAATLHDEAAEDFDRVIALDTTNVSAYELRGRVHLIEHKYGGALSCFQKAYRMNNEKTTRIVLQLQMAVTEYMLEEYTAALERSKAIEPETHGLKDEELHQIQPKLDLLEHFLPVMSPTDEVGGGEKEDFFDVWKRIMENLELMIATPVPA